MTISDEKARSISHKVDILASFDAETVFQHYQDVQKVIIYNKGVLDVEKDRLQGIEPETAERIPFKAVKDVIDYLGSKGVTTICIDYDEILKKVAEEMKLPAFRCRQSKEYYCYISVLLSFRLKERLLIRGFKKDF